MGNDLSIPQVLLDAVEVKAAGSPSLRLAWQNALARAWTQHAGDTELKALIEQLRSPRSLAQLAEMSVRSGESLEGFWRAIRAQADDSDRALAEWIEALEALLGYLTDTGRRPTLEKALGYVGCTAEAAPGVPLAEALRRMLAQYGFEG